MSKIVGGSIFVAKVTLVFDVEREESTTKKLKNKWIAILLCVAAVLCFTAGYQTARYIQNVREAKITVASISEKLEDCSELTTACLTYNGLIRYSDGNIPFINKKSFSMIYEAEIKAGIDLSAAKISVVSDSITIKLPETEVLSVEVDTDNLEFYDERFALFNWTDKADTSDAVAAAKEDAESNADIDSLKNKARNQAESIVRKLIEPVAGDKRGLIVK